MIFLVCSLVILTTLETCFGAPVIVNDRPKVTVNEGVILGMEETQEGVDMFTYRGIPYAEPPVHELRFMVRKKK